MMRGILMAGGVAALALAAPNALTAAGPKRAASTVTVTNTRSVPVTVYVDHEPFDFRIGTVAPHSKQTLSVPEYMTYERSVRFVVSTADGWDLETPDLDVTPGASLKVLVPLSNVGFVSRPPDAVIPNPGTGVTTITVQNERSADVTLYVEQGDFDYRIGTVPAHLQETLRVAPAIVRGEEDVRIFVEPKNGMDLASDDVTVKPGAHLLVTVPAR